MDDDLENLRRAIIGAFPGLASAPMSLHHAGWDSIAVDIEDRLICKFPRQADGVVSLRREQQLLAAIGPRVDLLIPKMRLVEGERLFSIHEKLKGEHLLSQHYRALHTADRQTLAETLARFYVQLHAIDQGITKAAGGLSLPAWPEADVLSAQALSHVPENLRTLARATIFAWQNLPPDPHGDVYGFFDGHGWNMAFDHSRRTLNGVYDFGDSGFGPLHREFIYASFIEFDLTDRLMSAYEAEAGIVLDRDRIDLLTGIHRIIELAETANDPEHASLMVENFTAWAASRSR